MLFITAGCDFNPLGGSKSKFDPLFEPGKHVQSKPPSISTIANVSMEENDVATIPFTISDPDSILMCSLVSVKAYSSNETLIDSSGLLVGGTFPNCTLTMTPKTLKYGVSDIKVEVYDFWTKVSSTFQLTVIHVLAPGAFSIVDATGTDQAIQVTWSAAAYMTGVNAKYSLFYRQSGSGSYTQISNVTSPYNLTGLTNGVVYDIYIQARNTIGTRNSQTVQAFPSKYKVFGSEFVPASDQYVNTPGTFTNVQVTNSTMLTTETITDSNYPTLAYSASEMPVNSPITPGSAKPSAITSVSGKYKIYMNSQGSILSGDAQ